MTTRNFDALFTPKSIVLVGASNQPGSVGAVIARNLMEAGFNGPVMTVNPREVAIRTTLNYRTIADLPVVPDLAVVSTPAPSVPGIIAELGARGCRAAVVISAGFESQDSELRQQLLDAAKPHLMRIVGPNCLGFLSPGFGINASFAQLTPKAGGVAFLTQSGAVATTMLDWAAARDIGFSHIVSLGDMSDVDFGDLLDHLALDSATRSILMYVETITHPRKFMSAARIAARAKPVIVVKSGRSKAGAAAALSHTGALAGSDAVYDAAFQRAGLLRVHQLRDVFDAVDTLATGVRIHGDRLAIVTNGGGLGVLAADAVEELGGHLADLSEGVRSKLDAVLPAAWSKRNPIDILGDAGAERYEKALEALLTERNQDAVLVINCPTGVADATDAANGVLRAKEHWKTTPLITCWVGEATAGAARRTLSSEKLPAFETPTEAVRAFMHLVNYRRNQEQLLEAPERNISAPKSAVETAQSIIESALAGGRTLLDELESKQVLSAYGIKTTRGEFATTPEEAAEIASDIGGKVALKIISPQISHKSDIGGVKLDLEGSEEVRRAASQMLEAIGKANPEAKLSGFSVQEMVHRPRAHELIVGMTEDATFGPVLLFGQGGTAVEVVADKSIALAPLNSVLARDMISRTRVARLLDGYRDVPPTDLNAIAETLVKISELIVDLPQIAELDINPLFADEKGVIALDARIVIRSVGEKGVDRLAIRPYPSELERSVELSSGNTYRLRPIRPSDEEALVAFISRSTPEDRRLRFLGVMNQLPHALAARLSQIDYDREMAFVAINGADGEEGISGVVRLICDPNNESGEYAVMVRSDLKGQGLGYRLMTEILDYARARGLQTVFGDVLHENTTMIQMARQLGAEVKAGETPDLVKVTFRL